MVKASASAKSTRVAIYSPQTTLCARRRIIRIDFGKGQSPGVNRPSLAVAESAERRRPRRTDADLSLQLHLSFVPVKGGTNVAHDRVANELECTTGAAASLSRPRENGTSKALYVEHKPRTGPTRPLAHAVSPAVAFLFVFFWRCEGSKAPNLSAAPPITFSGSCCCRLAHGLTRKNYACGCV